MSHYIDPSYITDKLITDFIEVGGDNLEKYFDLMDAALASLARRNGVTTTNIDTDDNGYVADQVVKDWCAAWIGKRICWDNKGRNNPTIPDEDKYYIAYKDYSELLADAERQITHALLIGTDEERTDYAGSTYCFRG